MEAIGKREFKEIKEGDIFSTTNTISENSANEHTLVNKVMRPYGKYEAYMLGKGFDTEEYDPNEMVWYFGRSNDEHFLTPSEIEAIAADLWNNIKGVFTNKDAVEIQLCYSCELFGKSGRYGEIGKQTYYTKNLLWLRKLEKTIRDNGITKIDHVTISNIDDVPNLKHSFDTLTECYGKRGCLFDFLYDGKHLYC